MFHNQIMQDKSFSTRGLTAIYISSLSLIALILIFGYFLINQTIRSELEHYHRIINIAGRQRMLSQRITKFALAISTTTNPVQRNIYIEDLRGSIDIWKRSHEGLQHGDIEKGLPGKNSPEITRLFSQIDPHYQTMIKAAEGLLLFTPLTNDPDYLPKVNLYIQWILPEESAFLNKMDEIVSQYEKESKMRVDQLRIKIAILILIVLIVLSIEGLFIFRPAVKAIKFVFLKRQEIEQEKNEFLAIVSHELRTPFAAILGSLGLLTQGKLGELPPEAKKLAEIAYKNSNQLVTLINDLLELEKLECGKMKFEVKPVELNLLLMQAIEINNFQAEQCEVKFILENSLPAVKVNADSFRLMQVLTNLFSNAVKFSSEKNTVIIMVSRYNENIRVAITDQGIGILPEFQKHIFQKFTQADSSKKRGGGLGLYISKNIIEKMGGQIGFETKPNGTTFWFDLPEWREEK